MSLTDYDKTKIKETIKKYAPITINPYALVLVTVSCFNPARMTRTMAANMAKTIEAVNNCYDMHKRKVLHNFASNNWLKIHHYPMRRKRAL